MLEFFLFLISLCLLRLNENYQKNLSEEIKSKEQ